MEDNMQNNGERRFINLSKPISDLYQETDTMPNGYNNQQDIMPNGYNNINNQQDRMPNGYNNNQQDRMPDGYNNNNGFNPQAYQQDIYPKTSPIYKEMSIPQSSYDIPTVQPSIVNPPIVQNNVNTSANQNQQSQTKFCKYCGQKIHSEAVVCTHCGRQVEQLKNQPDTNNVYINNAINNNAYPMPVSPYSKNTALLLSCLGLIGLGGIHRLYAGKYASGIIYLLTGGLFYVGTIIDIIKIAQGDFRDKNGFQIKN